MRALGVDLGSKRIGIAVSAGLVIASPLKVIQRSGNTRVDHEAIAALAEEELATCIVVGMPTDLRGNKGVAAEAVAVEVDEMATVMAVPVHTYDERFTTAAAAKRLREAGRPKTDIDMFAAAVMLQGWLESRPFTSRS